MKYNIDIKILNHNYLRMLLHAFLYFKPIVSEEKILKNSKFYIIIDYLSLKERTSFVQTEIPFCLNFVIDHCQSGSTEDD